MGLTVALTSRVHRELIVESDNTSDRIAMLGSMVLWMFWPSFCCAVVPHEQMPQTAVNTILALCGATVMTYILSSLLRKGVDTCGVHNLHGMPGLLGGIVAIFVVPGLSEVERTPSPELQKTN